MAGAFVPIQVNKYVFGEGGDFCNTALLLSRVFPVPYVETLQRVRSTARVRRARHDS